MNFLPESCLALGILFSAPICVCVCVVQSRWLFVLFISNSISCRAIATYVHTQKFLQTTPNHTNQYQQFNLLTKFMYMWSWFWFLFSQISHLCSSIQIAKKVFGHSNTHLIGLKCWQIVCVRKIIHLQSDQISWRFNQRVGVCVRLPLMLVLVGLLLLLQNCMYMWIFRGNLQSQQIELTE